MLEVLKKLFGIIVFLVAIAVIGRVFFFQLVQTNSYSMIPTLVPGDTFLVATRATMGPGDIVVCRNPASPQTMVVGRVLGIPGSTFAMTNNVVYINGDAKNKEFEKKLLYVDNTSGEELNFLVSVTHEYIGGHEFKAAVMERAGDRDFDKYEVERGFFLVGDNRNRARDSRHFGEIPIKDCIGKAVIILWPGKDSGEILRSDRFFKWLYTY